MKIVMIANNFYPCIGGVEKVVFDSSKKLIEKGHKVKVICLNKCANSKEKLKENENLEGIEIERIPYFDLKYYKFAMGVLSKIKDSDIVHVHGIGFFSDFLIATKFFHKKKIVVSTHGGIFHTKKIAIMKKIYFNIIQKIILGFADRVIAVSKNDKLLFEKIMKNVTLVENGVNTDNFFVGKKKKNTFLYLGRFSKNKQVEKIIETFALLKSDYELIIAGTDWEKLLENYKSKAEEFNIANKVKFVINPSSEETKALYASSEYFVSASRYEGFGIALVEGMASGCKAIVQKNEGFGNIINDGINGYFVNYADPKNAVKKIEKIIVENKQEISKNAILRAKDFSWKSRINELEKVYESVIN